MRHSMKHWNVTTNMSQNLTGFNILSAHQIFNFAKAERDKFVETGKTQSYNEAVDKKPLFPSEPWIIQMAFEEFKEKYRDIGNVEIIEIEIKALDR